MTWIVIVLLTAGVFLERPVQRQRNGFLPRDASPAATGRTRR